MRLAALALVLVVLGAATTADWRATYRNAVGTSCCGERDCFEVDYEGFPRIGDLVVVQGMRILVNVRYPSLDGRAYMCTTGCFFYKLGV